MATGDHNFEQINTKMSGKVVYPRDGVIPVVMTFEREKP